MKCLLSLALVTCCGIAQASSSNHVLIASGFVTASKWRSLPENARMLYVLGVVDGMKFSPILADGADKTNKLTNCTSQMDGEQILAIAQKQIDTSPELWHEAAHFRIFEAFSKACGLFKR